MNTPCVFRSPNHDHIARVGMGAGDLVFLAGLALAEMKVEVEVSVHAPAVGAEQDPA
jgi:hypothetical protein